MLFKKPHPTQSPGGSSAPNARAKKKEARKGLGGI